MSINTEGLFVEIVQKRIRNLYLRVYPETGRIIVSAPVETAIRDVESFIKLKQRWIHKHLSAKRKRISIDHIRIREGETVPVWGEMKTVSLIKTGSRQHVRIRGESELIFNMKSPDDSDKALNMLSGFYRDELKLKIPGVLSRYEKRMGVKVMEFGVKKMKTRWGSCNIRDKRIWLNLELAMRDPAILEYIVVHEMVHLLERLHNKRFYGFMDQFLPEWKEREKQLRNGLKSC
jgi:predicted metal-dependent hydrolase